MNHNLRIALVLQGSIGTYLRIDSFRALLFDPPQSIFPGPLFQSLLYFLRRQVHARLSALLRSDSGLCRNMLLHCQLWCILVYPHTCTNRDLLLFSCSSFLSSSSHKAHNAWGGIRHNSGRRALSPPSLLAVGIHQSLSLFYGHVAELQ